MSPGTTILAAFITLAAIYGIVGLSLSVKRVPPGHVRNVARLPLTYFRWDTESERHRTLGPGWHLVFPGRDQVGGPIDLREQAVTLNGQRVLTAGRASVTVNTKLSFQITDPLAAVTVGDQNEAVAKLVPMMLSQIIANTGPGQRLASRDTVSTELRERLTDASARLGIRLDSVEVGAIVPAADTGSDGPAEEITHGPGPGEDALSVLQLQRAQEMLERLQRADGSAFTGTRRGLYVLLGFARLWVALTLALAFALVVLPFTLRDVGPAWSAHLGHGEPGIFTAYAKSCSSTCSWYGDFTADSGYTRTDVGLASGTQVSYVGDGVAAVDTGDPKVVYPAGGGTDWIWLTAVLAAQATAIICVPIYLARKLRRRASRALSFTDLRQTGYEYGPGSKRAGQDSIPDLPTTATTATSSIRTRHRTALSTDAHSRRRRIAWDSPKH